jgi:hypothetical protein
MARGIIGMREDLIVRCEKELERANNLAREFEKYQL